MALWASSCTLPQSYGHIALGGVLPCRGPGLRLLRTQPHSCRRCCSVWPCGWHGMLLCTQPPPVAHCGLTALYAMLYVGVTMLVPLTRKLWGSGPCGITKPLFHSRWKPIGPLLGIKWVVPCQINTKNGRPLWIFLKFGETNAYTEKLGHTKFLPHP